MRYITLKTVDTRKHIHQLNNLPAPRERAQWQPVKLDYRSQIETIIGEALETQRGERVAFDRQANKKALRIFDALDKVGVGNVLRLEDADFDFLKSRLDMFIWPWADRAFEQFCVDIETAPKEEPKQEEPAEAPIAEQAMAVPLP